MNLPQIALSVILSLQYFALECLLIWTLQRALQGTLVHWWANAQQLHTRQLQMVLPLDHMVYQQM